MHAIKAILIGIPNDLTATVEADLRTEGAEVERQYADFTAALAELHLPEKSKYLVVTVAESAEDLDRLRRLSDRFRHPILVLSTAIQEGAFALEAMRAGANQLVSLPLNTEEFRHAVERIAQQFGFQAETGRIIAVSGVTEGSGATTIAMNLAGEFAAAGKKVVLAETGQRIGRLAVMLNITPKYTTEDLLPNIESMDVESVRGALTAFGERFHVLPGPYQTLTPAPATPRDLERLLGFLRRVADVAILDMPYTFDDAYFAVLGCADHLVLVAEQKVPSVHAMMVVREALRSRGITAAEHLVINRYSTMFPGATLAEIKHLLKAEKVMTIASDGMAVLTALNNGLLLRDAAPRSPVLDDLDRLADDIAAKPMTFAAPQRPAGGMLHRLGHLIGCD